MRTLYKIVHTSSRTHWGPPEKRILEESVWMEAQGHKIVVIAPKESPLFLKARDHGLSVYALSFKGIARISEYRELIQILKNEQPYVVNAHGRADAKMALKAARKTGVSCRIISRHTGSKLRNTWTNKKIYKKHSHYVFTTAHDTTLHLQHMFGLKDMEIFSIPGGIIEPKILTSKEEARKELAQTLDLEPETRFIEFSGRLPEIKRLATILKAYKQIKPGFSHHLVFSGEISGEVVEKLMKLSDDMDIRKRIHFHTPKPGGSWALHRACDCCILTSSHITHYEGVPQEMLEAMYSSCPVIGSRTNGITDILFHEKTGLHFDPESPDDLSKMIRLTLGREASAMERVYAARKQVQKHHTIDAMGRDITRIYRLHQVKMERRFLIN